MRGYSQEEFEDWMASRGLRSGLHWHHLVYLGAEGARCTWDYPRRKSGYRGFLNSLLRAAGPEAGFFVYFSLLRAWSPAWDRRWFAALKIPVDGSGLVYFDRNEPLLRVCLYQQFEAGRDLDVIPDHGKVILRLTNDGPADVHCRDWDHMKRFAFKMAGRHRGLPDSPRDVAAALRAEYLGERRLRGRVNLLLERG